MCPAQERERRRALEQKRGALTILDQLAERERERMASEERRRMEGEEMTRRIQLLREEEQKARRCPHPPPTSLEFTLHHVSSSVFRAMAVSSHGPVPHPLPRLAA